MGERLLTEYRPRLLAYGTIYLGAWANAPGAGLFQFGLKSCAILPLM